MRLDDYFDEVRRATVAHQPDSLQTALSVRALTQAALGCEPLKLECVERVVSSIERAGANWRNPPLHHFADPALIFRVFYWPPGLRDDPHRHDEWTVTGILHNEVVVETFSDLAQCEQSQPAPDKRICAHAGDTGYLVPPCVHRIQNASALSSATFHVFSAAQRQRAERPASHVPPQGSRGSTFGSRRRALLVLSAMLAHSRCPAAVELIQRIFKIEDIVVRLSAVKALAAHDLRLAHAHSRLLEDNLREQDRAELHAINAKLESLWGRAEHNGAAAG